MFAGAMQKADVKQYARKADAPRFNWIEFFSAGIQELQSRVATQEGTAQHVKKGFPKVVEKKDA